jgi:hypothetical protein
MGCGIVADRRGVSDSAPALTLALAPTLALTLTLTLLH